MHSWYEVDFEALLEGLDRSYIEHVRRQARYFSEEEAWRRDEILEGYFGRERLELIADRVAGEILKPPAPRRDARILDVGAGSGLLTVKVAVRVKEALPEARFYAMDVSPAMLRVIAGRAPWITVFPGVAENILGSVGAAGERLELPERFDIVYSTLTLHHCIDVGRVLKSVHDSLDDGGKAVVLDLCEHSFTEFREEMGDLHLGFNPSRLREEAERYFSKASAEVLPGVKCTCSGRSVNLFILTMIK